MFENHVKGEEEQGRLYDLKLKEVGLKKESTVRITSGIREISPEDFKEKVGKLSPSDICEVQER